MIPDPGLTGFSLNASLENRLTVCILPKPARRDAAIRTHPGDCPQGSVIEFGSAGTADPPAFTENGGPESQIDPGLGGLRHAMLPEGLGCALHDKETAVLELDRDRRATKSSNRRTRRPCGR